MSENKITQKRYYWLNPSLEKDRVYKVHYNDAFIDNGKWLPWMYDDIPPERQPLGWRYVHAKHLVTDKENEEVCKANKLIYDEEKQKLIKDNKLIDDEEKQKLIEATELIKEIEQAKKFKLKMFIGDSEPIAQGITAFFIKRTHGNSDDYGSVSSLLERNDDFDIYDCYEAYWEEQKSFAERLNKTKTNTQGRLSAEAFNAKFIEDHLIQEQDLFKASAGFFSDDFHYKTTNIKSVILDYAEGYLKWVAKKSKDIIKGYDSGYTPDQIEKTYDRYIQKKLFKPTDVYKQAFIQAFTGQILRAPVLWQGSLSSLSRIIWVLTNERPKPQKVNNLFIFPKNKRYDSNDTVPENSFNKEDYLPE